MTLRTAFAAAAVFVAFEAGAAPRNRQHESRPAPDRTEQVNASTRAGKSNFGQIDNPMTLLEQLDGMTFEWPTSQGMQRDIGCFPSGDLATSLPEVMEWTLPGEMATGVRPDRVVSLLVEAVKHAYRQLEHLHTQVSSIATEIVHLQQTDTQHANQLQGHSAQLSVQASHIAALQQKNRELEEKQKQMDQKNQQQDQEIAALKAAMAQMAAAMAAGG